LTPLPPGKQVHLPGVVQSDSGLQQWIAQAGNDHLHWINGSLACVDVSKNNLSDVGAEHLVNFLLEKSQPTMRLKLFDNQLCEPLSLCRLIEDQVCGVGADSGLQELHLSDNKITEYALERLLRSVSRMTVTSKKQRRPLWLRIEKNGSLHEGARRLAEKAKQDEHLPSVCLEAGQGQKSVGCNLHSCKHGAEVHLLLDRK